MKRSEIREAIEWAIRFAEKKSIALPPFAGWLWDDWKRNAPSVDILSSLMMGWDVTDHGRGEFLQLGAVLLTVRNGSRTDPERGTPYAEKYIFLKEEQRIPLHFHGMKTEDIINRAGGVLSLRLYNSLDNGRIDEKSLVSVFLDGVLHEFQAGEVVDIQPGASITIKTNLYHTFWAKKGGGDVICGEVSSVNDDRTDNVFGEEDIIRFIEIEEDEEVVFPLCHEYKGVLER